LSNDGLDLFVDLQSPERVAGLCAMLLRVRQAGHDTFPKPARPPADQPRRSVAGNQKEHATATIFSQNENWITSVGLNKGRGFVLGFL
jgi:hypothetical protein